MLEAVAEMAAPMAQQRGLGFACRIEPGTPAYLRGDPVRVRQILLNLVGNALKFTEQGRVDIEAGPGATGGIVLRVRDTGPGISAEEQARLFRRFEQGEGALTAARYGGSGLGLAICQELSAAMGGRIRVDSAPGQGTCFVVELPLPAAAPPQVPPGQAPADTVAVRPLQILLVEDDSTIAEVIGNLLRARGHRVTAVGHGLAALTEVAMSAPDIALLDLDLPGMDGLSLARQLRAQGLAAPLLAVTARADADAEAQARAAGFDGFLRKPVTGQMLAAAIAALVAPARGQG